MEDDDIIAKINAAPSEDKFMLLYKLFEQAIMMEDDGAYYHYVIEDEDLFSFAMKILSTLANNKGKL